MGYWEAARQHELQLQRCRSCDRFQHFPAPICSTCGGRDLYFDRVAGSGTIYSFIVVHHVVTRGFEDRAPYVVAWIELPEQANLRVLSDIVDCQPSELALDLQVEVFFDDVTEEFTIPRFRLTSTR